MAFSKSLIYLSPGNLPSQWAHTVQIAKMAQAFSRKIKDFELVTSGDLLSMGQGMDADFQDWYGLKECYKLVRLPVHLQSQLLLPQNYRNVLYYKLAVIYSLFKEDSLVYTRTSEIVELLLKIGKPVIWECHEPIEKDSLRAKLLKDRNLIGVVTISSQLAENYIQLGLDTDKLLMAHSGVDLNSFLPVLDKNLARQNLSLATEAKIILYSGHLYDSKGIPTILNLARLMPDCQFLLLGGWSTDVNRVKKNLQKEGLLNVSLIGHLPQSELVPYLYAADILILPTSQSWNLAEVTSPLKLFEYMAVGKPIVASALPNIMTVLRDRENAVLADPDNPISFQKAIVDLFENSHLATTIAERAFQDVQNFTWDIRANRIWQFALARFQEFKNTTYPCHHQMTRFLNLKNLYSILTSDLDPFFQEVISQDKNSYNSVDRP